LGLVALGAGLIAGCGSTAPSGNPKTTNAPTSTSPSTGATGSTGRTGGTGAGGGTGSAGGAGAGGDVIAVDNAGNAIAPAALAIAGELLTDARGHDEAAINALWHGASASDLVEQDAALDRPGAYEAVVTMLTEVHAVGQDGYGWPGFLLSQGSAKYDKRDLLALGLRSYRNYTGVQIDITLNPETNKFQFAGLGSCAATPTAAAFGCPR
jgi:hypothetical protein